MQPPRGTLNGMSSVDDRELHHTPGPTYQARLDEDRYPVPAILRERAPWAGDLPGTVPRQRYLSREVHQLEVDHLWSRVWQLACREEHLRSVGDSILYEIGGREFILVRSDDRTIKAFPNSCLHRGQQLRDGDGAVKRLRCPFHGFTWNLHGALEHIPAEWDFEHVPREDLRLPEARVATWGGFVFINPAPEGGTLESFLGDLPRHFERFPLDTWYTHAHAAKVVPCNWKLIIEAFLEGHHIYATHPQTVAGTDPCNSQYDIWKHFTRILTPVGVPSVMLRGDPSEQRKMDAAMGRASSGEQVVSVPDGVRARHLFADIQRKRMANAGFDRDYCDAELVDLHSYGVFPNVVLLGGSRGMVVRARPHADSPDHSVIETIILRPPSGDAGPPPAPVTWISDGEGWADHSHLADYALVDQDITNLIRTHRGLKNLPERPSILARYQEAPIAWFHHTLFDEWLTS